MSSAAAEDELENLFDKIADAKQRELRAAPPGGAAESRPGDTGPIIATVARGDLYTRIGNLARQLHEALRALGADQIIIKAAREFPDARDRLSYIARVTEQAAHRVGLPRDAAVGFVLDDGVGGAVGQEERLLAAPHRHPEFRTHRKGNRLLRSVIH